MAAKGTTEPTRRLTAIELAGYKSAIDPVRVNFRDITILAGANSTGKSTIMQPMLLIKQTIEKPFDPGALAIDGPLVRFTNADQFFSHGTVNDTARKFTVAFEDGTANVKFTYGRSSASGIDLIEMSFGSDHKEYSWKNGQLLDESQASIMEALSRTGIRKQDVAVFLRGEELRVTRDRVLLVARFTGYSASALDVLVGIASPADAVVGEIRNLIYLPGLRGNPERHYVISAGGPQYPGNFNDYVASIIHLWGTTADIRLKSLENNLKLLGLTWRVTTRAVDDTRVEVRVGRLTAPARGGARDMVNIADVGFGVSQTLPVLVALLAAARDQIVFVEQPELHLHPRAQVALADILIQAADKGVRLVIETHSGLLILALQTAIAEGRITPDRVSLNWFTRDGTGQTHVAEAQIEEDGSYGDWPEDFAATDLDLQDRYMTLVEQRHASR
ncbi:MAG TPA: AAA family ATPase [Acetobacteraceae bacterium]|jgi:predicted ATPase